MRSGAFDPPAISADIWDRHDVTTALQRRDIGRLIALLRQWAGLSQTRIATATGIAQGRMSNYATGKHKIKEMAVWERIADGLDMPDTARAFLGLAPRDGTPAPRVPSPADQAEQRTHFARYLARARVIDPGVIRTLDGETDAIRRLDRRLGAPAVTAKLQVHIEHVRTSLRFSLLPAQREALAAVLADASSLAGWQAIDMGNLPDAWDHYQRATSAAREAGDTCQLAYATGEQAYVLADLGHHHDALELVRAAHDQARTAVPSQIKVWLYAAEGEMAAATGDESACRHSLDQAAQEIEHGPSDDELPYLSLNTAHLARWRGNCLVAFGDPETADDLAQALDAMDASFTRAEAGLRCDLAAALHVRGERDEAHHQLGRARDLAQLTGSTRRRRRIRDLARRLGPAT
ncbi:MAG TPA: helix-turn-helix transcriptional regulator [Pseudonocardiaceae bacterium]|jgi:tetratricopeptide (TPR) repeat protein|nr:helix-turn-helix transcriptional regulator [Pseudonocardiaceae bacterium]